MKILSVVFLLLVSMSSQAEVCEGINACTEMYTKLTGNKIKPDKNISDEMTLAVADANLTKENAVKEYKAYLNKNGVNLSGDGLWAMRKGDYLTAPIYVVSDNNIPQMINKDGLVTLVYHSKKAAKNVVTAKVRSYLTRAKSKDKTMSNVVTYDDTNIVHVSNTYENASKMMREILKNDK